MKKSNTKRSPSQKRSIRTKNKLYKSGIKLFNKKGYFNTNSKEIATSAGVAVGSFYAYFKDKKDLLITIYLQNLHNLEKEISAILKKNIKKNSEKILALIVEEILNLKKYPLICFQEILLLSKTDKDFLNVRLKVRKVFIQFSKTFFKLFKGKMYSNNFEEAAFLIISLIENLRSSMHYIDKKVSKKILKAETVCLIERYLFQHS